MQSWNPTLQTELQRLYDLTTALTANGGTTISPVTLVGPGADPAISGVSRFAFATGNIVATAGNQGEFGICIPVGDPRIAVIRSLTVGGTNGNQYQLLLQSSPSPYVANALPPVPTNKRNDVRNIGPNWGRISTGPAAGSGDQIGFMEIASTLNLRWPAAEGIVLTADTALIVRCAALAQTYMGDIVFDMYQPQSK